MKSGKDLSHSIAALLLMFLPLFALPLRAATYPPDPAHPPKLIWMPERQDIYNKMKSENHPYYQYIKWVADGGGVYGDFGMASVWMYAVTGNDAYAKKALQEAAVLWDPNWSNAGVNETFNYFFRLVWMYDWLYPYLKKSGLIQQHIDLLNLWADRSIGRKPYARGITIGARPGDSDMNTASYFALAALALATTEDNPRAAEFLNATWMATSGQTWGVGGLDATAIDRNTMRNEFAMYVQMAQNSLWIESSEYDLATYQFVVEGVEGLRTAAGRDHFPEVTAHYKQAATALLNQFTPDMKDSYKWGDDQQPDGIKMFHTPVLVAELAGATEKDPSIGPFVHRLFVELAGDPMVTRVQPRCFFFFNPYAPSADWRSSLPRQHYASGQGFVYRRTGWDPSSSYFVSFAPGLPRVDHSLSSFQDSGSGDFTLYRRGRWVLDHPIGYQKWSGLENITMIEGHGGPFESRGMVASESSDLYEYVLSDSVGSVLGAAGFGLPDNFIHEKSRHTIYLPSQDNQSDVVITYDRLHAQDPRTFPNNEWSRYTDHKRKLMDAAPARKEWIIHSPVIPTGTDRDFSWETNGQKVRVTTLLPLETTRLTTDLALLAGSNRFPAFGFVDPKELKVMNEVVPKAAREWETFLHVVSVTDGSTIDSALVRSDGKEANGAIVTRPGHSDFVAFFNASPGWRHSLKTEASVAKPQEDLIHTIRRETFLKAGYTVTWTAKAASSEVFLADLDPNGTWQAFINNEINPRPVPVSAQGVGRLRIDGAGAITLRLQANNADKNPPTLSAFTISNITDTAVTLTWTTDEMATTSALYGTTPQLGSATPVKAELSLSHTVTVTDLEPGTAYHVQARSVDNAGNANVSPILTARTAGTSLTAPRFVSHPHSITVTAGSPVIFSVSAVGSVPLQYEWHRSNDHGQTWVKIGGASSSQYTITSVIDDHNAQFRCVVTNAVDETTSNIAMLTVIGTLAPMAEHPAPEVAASPAVLNLAEGEKTIQFSNVEPGSKIEIYTPTGTRIRELQNPEWDGTDASGITVSAGVYVLHMNGRSYMIGIVK